jgi:NAD(P)-dependent dehydrogenase (short-subunit alcohol dehydrogenase family)
LTGRDSEARVSSKESYRMSSFSERVWLITGSSSGFGRALVEQVIAAGERVVATARNPETLADLELRAPDQLRVFALDVTDVARVAEVVSLAKEAWGRLDIVVNNAGYGLIGALEEYSLPQIERNLATNLMGPIHVMRAALPVFRAQKSGHFINLSAAAAISNYAGFSVYGGAKAALELISESVRAETAPFGIKVTLVEPGPFRTDFIGRSMERAAQQIEPYAATSGKFLGFLEKMNGRQPGDPDRAAAAIISVSREANPPFRLVLGKYAIDKTRRQLTARGNELNTWEAVGLATEFAPSAT